MAPAYKLIYFNVKGRTSRGETIRLLLAAAGVQYEDYRVDFKDWPALKPTMPFGTLPVFEVDGTIIAESGAICRFLAEKHGFMGKDALEGARIDSCFETITEIREKLIQIHFCKGLDKAEKAKTFSEKTLPTIMGNLEKYLISNKGGDKFLCGDQMSLADIHFVSCFAPIALKHPEVLKAYPKLDGLNNRVTSDKKISKWLADRPHTDI